MLLVTFIFLFMLSTADGQDGQMTELEPHLEKSTILGACRSMCLAEYKTGASVPPAFYWKCHNMTECRKCWDSCQVFSIGDPKDMMNECTGGCRAAQAFYNKDHSHQVKMNNLIQLGMMQKGVVVELDTAQFAAAEKKTRKPLIYSLFFIKQEINTYFIDQYTWPHVAIPYYNESATLAFVVSSYLRIVAFGFLQFMPQNPEDELILGDEEEEAGGLTMTPAYSDWLNNMSTEEPHKERDTRDHQEGSLKGYHWDLKTDEMRTTAEGLVEVQLTWNPFPATGTYTVVVSSFSKHTSFRALDRAAIFTVIPGEIYNVHVEFQSKRNNLVTLTSPVLVIDTIRNAMEESVFDEEERIEKYAILGVCITSVFVLIFIYLVILLAVKVHRRNSRNNQSRPKPKQYVMEVLPGKMEQVETVEMTYRQSGLAAMKGKHPGNLELNANHQNETSCTRPYHRDQRMTFAVQMTPVEEQSFVFPSRPQDHMNVARTYSLP